MIPPPPPPPEKVSGADLRAPCGALSDRLPQWLDAVVDLGLGRHHWLSEISSGAIDGDQVLAFRSYAQARLRRFNGVARHLLGLHLQECVFRFNYREENLAELLLQRLLAEPLRAGGALLANIRRMGVSRNLTQAAICAEEEDGTSI